MFISPCLSIFIVACLLPVLLPTSILGYGVSVPIAQAHPVSDIYSDSNAGNEYDKQNDDNTVHSPAAAVNVSDSGRTALVESVLKILGLHSRNTGARIASRQAASKLKRVANARTGVNVSELPEDYDYEDLDDGEPGGNTTTTLSSEKHQQQMQQKEQQLVSNSTSASTDVPASVKKTQSQSQPSISTLDRNVNGTTAGNMTIATYNNETTIGNETQISTIKLNATSPLNASNLTLTPSAVGVLDTTAEINGTITTPIIKDQSINQNRTTGVNKPSAQVTTIGQITTLLTTSLTTTTTSPPLQQQLTTTSSSRDSRPKPSNTTDVKTAGHSLSRSMSAALIAAVIIGVVAAITVVVVLGQSVVEEKRNRRKCDYASLDDILDFN